MKRKHLTKLGKTGILVVILGVLFGLFWALQPQPSQPAVATAEPTETPEPSSTPVPTVDPFQAEFDTNKAVNPEYLGKISFESGMIVQNLMQSSDNEKYLTIAWDGTASNEGAIYLDYRNQKTDQNMIIYGHYVYYNASAMFTPLEKLIDVSNYEANKYIDIDYGNGDKRRYLITDVYNYPLQSETLKYYMPNYDSTFFTSYYAAVKQADFYDTGETLTMNDRWISLQTCVRDHDELRQIILAKQISK